MKLFRGNLQRSSVAWGLASLLAFSVSFFAVSAPEAAAQAAKQPADDAKRYSQLIQNIYQFIIQNYVDEVDPSKLYEGAMKGMFDAIGDPHSTFLDEAMLADFMRETDGTYAGVGLYISKPVKSPAEGEAVYVEVVSPIEDTPAWKEGILPGDLIVSIDGESTAGLTVDQASAKIRGPEGSKVKLSFKRGAAYEYSVEFTRATIEIPAIKTGVIKQGGATIGYLRIIEWMPQTSERIKAALDQMAGEGITHLVVDVRSNPGGLLSSVVDVSDQFLSSGMIVSTRGRNSQENAEYKADPALTIPPSIKMVVLINRGSASASEIFSGAMKDRKRGLLIGEKSYGKGSVQQIFPLDMTGFKLTMARYYTPSGVNIDKTGIEPDIAVSDWVFSDAQLKELERLFGSGLIADFAKANPEAGAEARAARAREIAASGFDLPARYIEMLLRDELERTKPARVFDLDYDAQLQKAIDTLLSPDFDAALRDSKTLSQVKELSAASQGPATAAQAAAQPGAPAAASPR
jgi:carboxyl-terminal processing protease